MYGIMVIQKHMALSRCYLAGINNMKKVVVDGKEELRGGKLSKQVI